MLTDRIIPLPYGTGMLTDGIIDILERLIIIPSRMSMIPKRIVLLRCGIGLQQHRIAFMRCVSTPLRNGTGAIPDIKKRQDLYK